MLPTLVFVICNRRGDNIRATSDVEKSISNIAMLPSLVSKHFVKGSVVKIRKPFEVPGTDQQTARHVCRRRRTDSQMTVVLVESHKVHGHVCDRMCDIIPESAQMFTRCREQLFLSQNLRTTVKCQEVRRSTQQCSVPSCFFSQCHNNIIRHCERLPQAGDLKSRKGWS